GPMTSFVARLTSNFTPTLLNEFVASYTADNIRLRNIQTVPLPPAATGLTPLFVTNLGGNLPALSFGNTAGTVYGGGFNVDTGYFLWNNANPIYTYRDNLTKVVGQHTLIFGAYFVAAQKNQKSTADVQGQLSFSTGNPNITGNPFADM